MRLGGCTARRLAARDRQAPGRRRGFESSAPPPPASYSSPRPAAPRCKSPSSEGACVLGEARRPRQRVAGRAPSTRRRPGQSDEPRSPRAPTRAPKRSRLGRRGRRDAAGGSAVPPARRRRRRACEARAAGAAIVRRACRSAPDPAEARDRARPGAHARTATKPCARARAVRRRRRRRVRRRRSRRAAGREPAANLLRRSSSTARALEIDAAARAARRLEGERGGWVAARVLRRSDAVRGRRKIARREDEREALAQASTGGATPAGRHARRLAARQRALDAIRSHNVRPSRASRRALSRGCGSHTRRRARAPALFDVTPSHLDTGHIVAHGDGAHTSLPRRASTFAAPTRAVSTDRSRHPRPQAAAAISGGAAPRWSRADASLDRRSAPRAAARSARAREESFSSDRSPPRQDLPHRAGGCGGAPRDAAPARRCGDAPTAPGCGVETVILRAGTSTREMCGAQRRGRERPAPRLAAKCVAAEPAWPRSRAASRWRPCSARDRAQSSRRHRRSADSDRGAASGASSCAQPDGR